MEGTTQGRCQFRINTITIQKDLIIARAGRLTFMTVTRTIITGIDRSCNRHHRHMQQIPMPFIGMGKTINDCIFILIACTTPELGHRTHLYHGIGQGRSREHFCSPSTYIPCTHIAQLLRLPQGGSSQQRIHITRQRAPFHTTGQQTTDNQTNINR